ncbi:MAG: AbrB/MazE/SpoVT family DNA-binding domain-containing protein [Burkholderiales bacterium]|nr:AbrB/MazE/SpoVT family DNA-binding domain-containing protein [Burkholderiales bacterium]
MALTLPKKLLQSVGLGVGDRVAIAVERGRIVVRPTARPRYTLAELLARSKPRARLTRAEREWLEAPRAGREAL